MQNYTPEGMTEEHMAAISKVDGSYIGTYEFANLLDSIGIAPQAISGNHVASIGFCLDENKWYGWSHRAMRGFNIGSNVVKGDCAYVPVDWDDFLDDCIRFWSHEYATEVTARQSFDEQGVPCAKVQWLYTDDVRNEKLCGTIGGSDIYPPKEWGRGEWTAKTLEDAKQMATDFVNGVS